MLFWQKKNKWKLSLLPASYRTQLFGPSTPRSCNLTLVGKYFRQTRQRKFFIFYLGWHFGSPYKLSSSFNMMLFPIRVIIYTSSVCTFHCVEPILLCFHIILSIWTDSRSGVCRTLSAVASSTNPWIKPESHIFAFGCNKSAIVRCARSGSRFSGLFVIVPSESQLNYCSKLRCYDLYLYSSDVHIWPQIWSSICCAKHNLGCVLCSTREIHYVGYI
jgi:hypothetical protein